MFGCILTGSRARGIAGVNARGVASPVCPDGPAVYTDIMPDNYDDVFRLYHYMIYPHYLAGKAAVFAVPNFRQLEKKLSSISDPLPVGCPLTGEKALRHLRRLPEVTELPDMAKFTPQPQPLVSTPLDPDQNRAAAHFTGPALVVAPAGSGKTMTVVARVMLLVQRGIAPDKILCITFTRKAQLELRRRLVGALGDPGKKVTIKTYHALAYMLICELTGQKPDVITTRRQVLEEIIGDLDIRVDDADTYIGNRLNSLVLPDQVEPKNEREEVFRDVFAKYQSYLEEKNQLDQDNLLVKLYTLLRDDPAKREYIMNHGSVPAGHPKGRWHFVLVDEAQDNNLAQDVLTRFVAAPWDNIYWVGDEDQILYGFRGSSAERILSLREVYPNLKEIYLKTNYRSHPEIVQTADRLIRHNTKRRRKTIIPFRDDREIAVECAFFPDPLTELEWVAGRCGEMVGNGAAPGDIAVLYRTNAQADICASELAARKVPHYVHRTGIPLFETPEARAVTGYLKFIMEHDPAFLTEYLKYYTKDAGELIKKVDSSPYPLDRLRVEATSARQWRVVDFCDDMKSTFLLAGRLPNVGKLIGHTRKKFDLDRLFGGGDTSDRLGIIQAVAEKFTDLQSFLNWVNRVRNCPREEIPAGKVQLMTVHAAKGLEFPHVFIINVTEGHMPHVKADDIEEERRIFYVALTRARDRLYVTGYRNEDRNLSRFVFEAGLAGEKVDASN